MLGRVRSVGSYGMTGEEQFSHKPSNFPNLTWRPKESVVEEATKKTSKKCR